MKKTLFLLMLGASFAVLANAAQAADIIEEPVVIESPAPVVEHVAAASGWYLRGDLGYAFNGSLRGSYVTYGAPGGSNTISGDLDDVFNGGVGVGYQVTKYLRADLTADYFAKSSFSGRTVGGPCLIGGVSVTNCVSNDSSKLAALSIMANAYVDLGTYGRVTPYVGAGIGATHVKWDSLINTECDASNPASCNTPVTHGGGKGWRATFAVMAGASVDLTCNLKADAGYRYRHVEGGDFFDFAGSAGPGKHGALKSHEVRAGLRWAIGGNNCAPKQVDYEPINPPVYK